MPDSILCNWDYTEDSFSISEGLYHLTSEVINEPPYSTNVLSTLSRFCDEEPMWGSLNVEAER